MRKYLENLIARKKAELKDLEEKMKGSNDVAEVRAIGETLLKLRDEISDAEEQLKKLDEEPTEPDTTGPDVTDPAEENSRGMNPLASYGMAQTKKSVEDENVRSSMEYRKAFKDYVQKGNVSTVLQFRNNRTGEVFEKRENTPLTSADLGVLLPSTVVQEIIKEAEKVYGVLYSKVKKTNVKGGVKYPIGSFGATFKRIGETGSPTDRQKAGSVTGYVEFSYKIGEIRISQTLLEDILSVPVFESEVAKVILEAYIKAMDDEILNGVGSNNQCEGILTEVKKVSGSRILPANVITFNDTEMADWKAWQKKLFAKIPLSMRALKPEFIMTANTYEANIKTLADGNNRPVCNETFNPVDGTEKATFKGREVFFIEEGLGIDNFDDAENGGIFGFYWVPEKAYAVNTNLEFAVKRYCDEEKLEWVERAVVINDGKILDPKYIWVLKKGVSA